MFSFLPAPLIGIISFILYIANTVFWLIPILVFSCFKALLPLHFCQKLFSLLLDNMANNWVGVNTLIQKLFSKINIHVSGLEKLEPKASYLIICNHQSWVDINVMQRVLHNKIPFIKFFLKRELIYVPLLGLAWWALDFPFMKRYSQAILRKNPHLKGKDLETTRKACEKFKYTPVSLMSFIEGTRFTEKKHKQQGSPYQHLLKPKASSIAFVLDAMGEHLSDIVNITLYYPEGIPSFSDFVLGKINHVDMVIEVIPIDETLKGDYFTDRNTKIYYQKWVTELWTNKDKTMQELAEKARISGSTQ